MATRTRRPITALWAGLLAIAPAAAQEPPPSPPAVRSLPAELEPVHLWLDEVRAQRQAREKRRRAQKEAMDARRRWIDPWGAAQKEVREQETQRRRNAFMDHIERDRETFRNQVPWQPQQPWQDDTFRAPAQQPSSPLTDGAQVSEHADQAASPYPLPGWNNRWYYRGF